MKAKSFCYMPDGTTYIEKAFALFRHHVSIIARRTKDKPHCHKCFTRGWVRGCWTINHGCDGCAEMHDFIDAARELFKREIEAANGEGVNE